MKRQLQPNSYKANSYRPKPNSYWAKAKFLLGQSQIPIGPKPIPIHPDQQTKSTWGIERHSMILLTHFHSEKTHFEKKSNRHHWRRILYWVKIN